MPTLESSKMHEHDARLRELESWKETTDKRLVAVEERYSAIEARQTRMERQNAEMLMLLHEQRRTINAIGADFEHNKAAVARIETELMPRLSSIQKTLASMTGDETSPGDG